MDFPPVLAFLFIWLVLSIILSFAFEALGGWAFDRRNPFLSEDR